ncbi:MAG: type II toxin-antitoxin system HicA family toxin [Deltaproteobacteria bacterium]|nr:type II toxin-antitoxin system HicA family toxin [Deltaproteobacteria bacterium]
MSNLPRVSGRECVKALEKAGFIFRRQKGSHMTLTSSVGSAPPTKIATCSCKWWAVPTLQGLK